jgi:hypothetical protein
MRVGEHEPGTSGAAMSKTRKMLGGATYLCYLQRYGNRSCTPKSSAAMRAATTEPSPVRSA